MTGDDDKPVTTPELLSFLNKMEREYRLIQFGQNMVQALSAVEQNISEAQARLSRLLNDEQSALSKKKEAEDIREKAQKAARNVLDDADTEARRTIKAAEDEAEKLRAADKDLDDKLSIKADGIIAADRLLIAMNGKINDAKAQLEELENQKAAQLANLTAALTSKK